MFVLRNRWRPPTRLFLLQLNAGASLLALLATVRFIPVVKAYTLRRGMFGLDINKKGTPGGEVKV